MTEDLQDDVRAAGRTLRGMAAAEPVIAISRGIAKVGEVAEQQAKKAEKKAKSLWERIKEGYTTIRELAKAGKPKEGEKPKKGAKPKKKGLTPTEIGAIRRKAKRNADEQKRKAEVAKRQAPLPR